MRRLAAVAATAMLSLAMGGTPMLIAQDAPTDAPPEEVIRPPECPQPVPAPPPDEPAVSRDYLGVASGAGIRVAVIDTGVAAHPELGTLEAVADLVDPDFPQPLLDCDGHGTVVAGVIAGRSLGVAPDATVLSIRQTSAARGGIGEPVGTVATLAEAINQAVAAGANVINISVVACLSPAEVAAADLRVLDEALAAAEAAGVVVVAAAGNTTGGCADDSVALPAHAETVLTVGAREDAYHLADYSLPGADVSAGAFVPTAVSPTGEGFAGALTLPTGELIEFRGTSFAAPVVTGTVALLRQLHPELSAAEVRAHVLSAAEGGFVDPAAVLQHVPTTPASLSQQHAWLSPPHPAPDDVERRGKGLLAAAVAILVAAAAAGGVLRGGWGPVTGRRARRRPGRPLRRGVPPAGHDRR
ncbi:S8 family serine peptidase [Corynebacterium uterequi]|uniref:Subtilase family protease n=1 Tax=Corynebacterium uterequi TaxID=1072256 RepID=A0A0G3HGY3_9CORY|nr:S8 family serine peptidase [Corynebacterium uterequi]AKK10407.1 subtilase family protease [Corynebacterium uterequi]